MPEREQHNQPAIRLTPISGLLAAIATAVSGWIGYSALIVNHQVPLPSALDAERKHFLSKTGGLVSYYADNHTSGRPLVLIHSINAAASAYEMRPLFNHYRETRPVYALDLPGFGFSERSDRPYSPALYAAALLDFLMTQVRRPADVVALSLSGEFAARAALEQPDAFNSLTLISPTGFSERQQQIGMSDFFARLASAPLLAQAFYDLLVTRRSIHYFLQQSFVEAVFPALADYSYAAAHQPGARYVPLQFLSGRLFTHYVREQIYEVLKIPVLVIYDRDPYTRFDNLEPFVMAHANWYSSRITPTRGLPHFEHLFETVQALNDFWDAQEPLKPVELDNLSGWSAQDSQ
jgi:pimeloyl-ACP methyl ester carboxylesterase